MWLKWLVRTLLAVVIILAAGVLGLLALAWWPEIAPAEGSRSTFDTALIRKGAELAAIGNCSVCHTKPDGEPYAGGRPIETPFGNVFATNITPDPDTGIGRWSEAAFKRAMRDGVARDGRHLYPAFPYDHMTKVWDDDIKAVYAFIMTRQAVRAETPPNDLLFPLNHRILVAAWKLLFLDRGLFGPDRSKSEAWNRGAYLVEGLAHCGACHTPRNAFGAEERNRPYAGGWSNGWSAPALNAQSPAAVPWTPERLYSYLRQRREALQGAAAGPMAPVVHNLARVSDDDVRRATYVADVAGTPTRERQEQAEKIATRVKRAREAAGEATRAGAQDAGSAIYAGACAQCHGEAGRAPLSPPSTCAQHPVRAPEPANVVRIVLDGIAPPAGETGPIMPRFGAALTDQQVVALVRYVRANFSDRPAWPGLEEAVLRARTAGKGS